jgi:hypothetical protein
MLVILATQEAEIRKIMVQKPAWANSSVRTYLRKPFTKIGLVEWLKVKALSSSLSTTHTKKSWVLNFLYRKLSVKIILSNPHQALTVCAIKCNPHLHVALI